MKNFFKHILILLYFFHSQIFSYELPELGSSFDSILNNVDEKKIKFQIMQQVFNSNTVIRDFEINDYLNNLGKDLIEKGGINKSNIDFFIVEDKSINAFAMLGNVIGVHSGLIFAANSESELASVLSHEIAHISQKHLLRLFDSQARGSFKSYFALAIALLAARSNPQLASGAITIASASQVQNLLDFTRENEREADRVGLEILGKAGFDPLGFIDFFSTIQKFNNFSSGAAPSFLRTHPITTERISDIQGRLKDLKYIQKEQNINFHLIKAKLIALSGNYAEVTNYFKNEIDSNKTKNNLAAYYGLIYSLIRENQIEEARNNFNKSSLGNVENPMIIELNAQLLIKEREFEAAFNVYKRGINKYPFYRAFILGLSDLILLAKKPDKAIDLLKSFLTYFSSDPNFYLLLAKAYNLKGESLLEHESLSNAYYYQFNIQEAITQMDLAVKTNSDNFFNQSRVEYRLKELKRESDLMYNQ